MALLSLAIIAPFLIRHCAYLGCMDASILATRWFKRMYTCGAPLSVGMMAFKYAPGKSIVANFIPSDAAIVINTKSDSILAVGE
mmetsp:Transcript_7073/g.12705  ORF Transcript_7073/g.12705 Transcript_7073/m.12705 type:complete len:84 (-) Transcript_7073:563-814(-)